VANALYGKFKEALLNKEHDLDTDAVKATLIDKAYYDAATTILTDTTYVAGTNGVADLAKVAASASLQAAATITGGVFNTADFTWASVSGAVSEAILLWNDTPTTPVADPLIAWYDDGMTGMPVTPNGGDINVTVHTSGWFAL
jgi:hypothetical protein